MNAPLSETAYLYIHEKLARRELCSGQRVSEHRLARELGISRTPVREAIHRLKNDGLLVQFASSGTFVAEPNRRQLVDMYEIRIALEGLVVVKSVPKIRAAEMADLQAYADEMWRLVREFRASGEPCMSIDMQREFLAADLAFHQLIAAVAQNEMAYKIINDVHLRHRAFGLTSHRRDLHHVAWTWLYHARVAAAIRRRDRRTAKRLLQRHIRFSMREALYVFDTQQSPSSNRPLRRG